MCTIQNTPPLQAKLYSVIVILLILTTSNLTSQIYIAPNGSDNNPGTKEQPFYSLIAARNAIRSIKNESPKNKNSIIHIADGYYFMETPLVLETKDGGSKEYPIIYKAEKRAKPVFSGGKVIKGFHINKDGIWEVQIPKIKGEKWRFDQLYVNGKRATLAKTPNTGF